MWKKRETAPLARGGGGSAFIGVKGSGQDFPTSSFLMNLKHKSGDLKHGNKRETIQTVSQLSKLTRISEIKEPSYWEAWFLSSCVPGNVFVFKLNASLKRISQQSSQALALQKSKKEHYKTSVKALHFNIL